ncbi:MAG: sugar-binding domain-containing protein [Candidatus Fervidibacter sp.]|uniref:sugar-binding domain-containing protein n=1 Tax=Candidatus Fervidibacter sp. TaxID=3100871 RepID=UPI00404B1DB3
MQGLYFPQESFEIAEMDMDRLTAQSLRLQLDAVTVRDLFRVLWTKYHLLKPHIGAVPKSLLEQLRSFFPYRRYSFYQLRYFVRQVLKDPRCKALLMSQIVPPTDTHLSAALKKALPELKEAVIIPDISFLDPKSLNAYLGLTAAQFFAPMFTDGQRIGLSGGRALLSFAKALPHFVKAKQLRLYALSRFQDPLVSIADAEKAIMETIVSSRWKRGGNLNEIEFEGIVKPKEVCAKDLDWAFVEVCSPTESTWKGYAEGMFFDFSAIQKAGVLAEILFRFFTAKGLPPENLTLRPLNFEATPISVLREMVRLGRPVVALPGGRERASAVLAIHRASCYGGPLFNYLVTDEACAVELLRNLVPHLRLADIPGRADWWEAKNCFFAAHLRYASSSDRKTVSAISEKLKQPRKKVQQWLKKATKRMEGRPPIVSFYIRVPSPEYAAEVALVRRYGLLDARVVPYYAERTEQLVQVGISAAQLFCDFLKNQRQASVGLGSGYEVRSMVECLSLADTLNRFPKLERLEFCGLSESPILALTQGISTQSILTSIALNCGDETTKVKVSCYQFHPKREYVLDAAFLTLRAPYEGDLDYLRSAGLRCKVKGRAVGYLLNQFFDKDGTPYFLKRKPSVFLCQAFGRWSRTKNLWSLSTLGLTRT